MVPYVMTHGQMKQHQWFADNWDSLHMVLTSICIIMSLSNLVPYFLHYFVGAIALSNAQFSNGNIPTLVTSLACNGNENVLYNCTINSEKSCGRFEDAAIVCQGICLSIYLYLSISIYLSLSIYLYLSISIYLSMCPSSCLCVCLCVSQSLSSIHPPTHLPTHPSIK